MFRDMIEVKSKFEVVTNWNVDDTLRRGRTSAGVIAPGYSSANSRRQPIECFTRFCTGIHDGHRIKENGHRCVSRRQLDDAGNRSVLQKTKRAQDFD
jgi:hypothetical protein